MPTPRPLKPEEMTRLVAWCRSHGSPALAARNLAMVLVEGYAAFRISEVLSLRLADVVSDGAVVHRLTIERRNRKGKRRSHAVALHERVRTGLAALVIEMNARGWFHPRTHLFLSRGPEAAADRPISRQRAWQIVRRARRDLRLEGCVATHSLRKHAGIRAMRNSGNDVVVAMKVLGHTKLTSTQHYLMTDQAEIDAAVLAGE